MRVILHESWRITDCSSSEVLRALRAQHAITTVMLIKQKKGSLLLCLRWDLSASAQISYYTSISTMEWTQSASQNSDYTIWQPFYKIVKVISMQPVYAPAFIRIGAVPSAKGDMEHRNWNAITLVKSLWKLIEALVSLDTKTVNRAWEPKSFNPAFYYTLTHLVNYCIKLPCLFQKVTKSKQNLYLTVPLLKLRNVHYFRGLENNTFEA